MSSSPFPRPVPRWRTALVALAATAVVCAGALTLDPSPAQAASLGEGWLDGEGHWLGSYTTDVDGRFAYCADYGYRWPFDATQPAVTVEEFKGNDRQRLAEANYALARYGQDPDPFHSAAMALYVWWALDTAEYDLAGGDGALVRRAPEEAHASILEFLAEIRAESIGHAVTDPWTSLELVLGEKRRGILRVGIHPDSLLGTVRLTGAHFPDGATEATLGAGEHEVIADPGAPEYLVGAEVSVDIRGYGAAIDVYETPGAQRVVAAASTLPPLTAHAEARGREAVPTPTPTATPTPTPSPSSSPTPTPTPSPTPERTPTPSPSPTPESTPTPTPTPTPTAVPSPTPSPSPSPEPAPSPEPTTAPEEPLAETGGGGTLAGAGIAGVLTLGGASALGFSRIRRHGPRRGRS